MRHWPFTLVSALMLAACAAPASPPPAAFDTGMPSAPAEAPTVTPPSPSIDPSPSIAPSPTPTPSPSAAASPTPAPSPSGLAEANHGPAPFPSAPGVGAHDLAGARASAGAGFSTAAGAIDGRPYTEWSARTGIGQNTYLSIDLGATKAVSKVELLPDASPTSEVSFDVEVSLDAKTWKTVARSVLATGSNEAPRWGTATFASQATRYVRIVPTRWGNSWVAVWEVKIYP